MKVKITNVSGSGWYGYAISQVGFFNENILIADLRFSKDQEELVDYAKKMNWLIVNEDEIKNVQPIEKPLCGVGEKNRN